MHLKMQLPLSWLIKVSCFFFQRHRWSRQIWHHLLLPSFLLLLATPLGSHAQCFGGVETYEKTSGTTVICDGDCESSGLISQPDTAVTRNCLAICKQSANCNSFTVGKQQNLKINTKAMFARLPAACILAMKAYKVQHCQCRNYLKTWHFLIGNVIFA